MVGHDWLGCLFHNIPPFFIIMVERAQPSKGCGTMHQVLTRNIQGEVHENLGRVLPTGKEGERKGNYFVGDETGKELVKVLPLENSLVTVISPP